MLLESGISLDRDIYEQFLTMFMMENIFSYNFSKSIRKKVEQVNSSVRTEQTVQ